MNGRPICLWLIDNSDIAVKISYLLQLQKSSGLEFERHYGCVGMLEWWPIHRVWPG